MNEDEEFEAWWNAFPNSKQGATPREAALMGWNAMAKLEAGSDRDIARKAWDTLSHPVLEGILEEQREDIDAIKAKATPMTDGKEFEAWWFAKLETYATETLNNELARMMRFATNHDWGAGAYCKDGRIYVWEHFTVRGEIDRRYAKEQEASFDNLKDLREWAGY